MRRPERFLELRNQLATQISRGPSARQYDAHIGQLLAMLLYQFFCDFLKEGRQRNGLRPKVIFSTPVEFPIYRKYTNSRSYFKIVSAKEFVELQVVGSKVLQHRVLAAQFPEMRLVQDMLELQDERWVEASEQEFNDLAQGAQGSS